MTKREMEKKIIRAGLANRIRSLGSLLDLHRAYTVWGPFLWVHVRLHIGSSNREGLHKVELIVTDPHSTQRLFVTREQFGSFLANSVNDRDTFYPMLNSFIDWIRENGGKAR